MSGWFGPDAIPADAEDVVEYEDDVDSADVLDEQAEGYDPYAEDRDE